MRMFLISAASAFALLFCSHPQAAISVHAAPVSCCLVAAANYSADSLHHHAKHAKCPVTHSQNCHCKSCQC